MAEVRPDVLQALRACRLWRGASDASVRRLAECATVADAPRGTQLAAEGDPAERFAVLVSGKARVFHMAADGRRITFETMEAGDAVLAVAALSGGRYPAYVEVVTPATVAWLPRECLFELIESEPAVAHSIVANLAQRVVNFTSVVQTLALDVPQRLARYLFQRALSSGAAVAAGLKIDLGMSKTDLAAALGTVPETLSRALAKLRDDGLLDVHGSEVIVHDVGALARLGSGYEE